MRLACCRPAALERSLQAGNEEFTGTEKYSSARQTSRTQLGHQISKLEDVTPENWVSVRDAVLEALVQTQDAYAKAAQEYNNHP